MSECATPGDLGLRDASFRGVPFYVSNDKTDTGRRIVTHEFPMRDTPFQEDLGKKVTVFNVTGYIDATGGEIAKDALLAACSARGPAILVLPASTPAMVVCESISVTASLDKLGWFDFTATFKESGSLAPFAVADAFESLIGGLFDVATAALSAVYVSNFDTVSPAVSVSESAVNMFETFAAVSVAAIESVQVGTDYDSQNAAVAVTQAATGFYQNTGALVQLDPNTGAPRADVIPAVATILNGLYDATDAATAISVFKGLTTFAPVALPLAVVAPSDATEIENEASFAGAVRALATILYCKAVSIADYTNRGEAVQAKADLVETVYQQIVDAGPNIDVVNALDDARNAAVKALNTRITSLAPVLDITAPQSMPALYWAYRLYGDATRAQEVADRNTIADYLYIPSEFEALAS